jgi:hypothetical protein
MYDRQTLAARLYKDAKTIDFELVDEVHQILQEERERLRAILKEHELEMKASLSPQEREIFDRV